MQQPEETPQTPQEESIFNEQDYNMQGYDKHIRNARIMLFIVAGLELLWLFLLPSGAPQDALNIVIGTQVAVAAVFVGLGIWTKYKPFAALLTALIFYVVIHGAAAIFDPSTIFKGIALKVIVVILLVMGIRNAKEAMELKKTFGKQ